MLSNQQAVLKDLFQQKLTCTQTRILLLQHSIQPIICMPWIVLETFWRPDEIYEE